MPGQRIDIAYIAALGAALPAIGVVAAATPAVPGFHWPGASTLVFGVLVLPVLEEVVFRLGVHDGLARIVRGRWGPLSGANALTAVLFALAHLVPHPPGWAAATFVPALVFGWAWERYGWLAAPIGLHAVYNAVFFFLLTF